MRWDVAEPLARWEAAAALLHDGATLRCAAVDVLENLPDGQVVLVATSVEGAALAASCSLMAPFRSISWQIVNPLWCYPPPAGIVVAVAPIDPGDGWKTALARRFPGIRFAFPRLTLTSEMDELRRLTESQLLPVAPQLQPELPRRRSALVGEP